VSREDRTVVEVEGRQLVLSNLERVLYPEAGFTKAEVISYYVQIAAVLLPHLAGRPVTFVRAPDGVAGASFFQKQRPKGAPPWVRTIEVPRTARPDGRTSIEFPELADLPSLVWAANLAALELHVPLWRSVRPGEFGPFDQMVFDLDPGAPATVVECCQVASWLWDALGELGYQTVLAKTSGLKGLQLYVPLEPPRPWEEVREEARSIALGLEHEHRDLVVSNMRRDLRVGKVLIDWSQNTPVKTTVVVYSLRVWPWPTVSTPVTVEEVRRCARSGDGDSLRFLARDVLGRVERKGDLFGEPASAPRPGRHRARAGPSA